MLLLPAQNAAVPPFPLFFFFLSRQMDCWRCRAVVSAACSILGAGVFFFFFWNCFCFYFRGLFFPLCSVYFFFFLLLRERAYRNPHAQTMSHLVLRALQPLPGAGRLAGPFFFPSLLSQRRQNLVSRRAPLALLPAGVMSCAKSLQKKVNWEKGPNNTIGACRPQLMLPPTPARERSRRCCLKTKMCSKMAIALASHTASFFFLFSLFCGACAIPTNQTRAAQKQNLRGSRPETTRLAWLVSFFFSFLCGFFLLVQDTPAEEKKVRGKRVKGLCRAGCVYVRR